LRLAFSTYLSKEAGFETNGDSLGSALLPKIETSCYDLGTKEARRSRTCVIPARAHNPGRSTAKTGSKAGKEESACQEEVGN
jgi:hypothetical protein